MKINSININNNCKIYFIILLLIVSLIGCGTFRSKETVNNDSGEFFLTEKDYSEHGKKGTLDRLYQLDPGGNTFKYDEEFINNPPHSIAVLPFENLIGGNLILNGFEIKREDEEEEEEWNWTYANRLRTYFYGHLVPREFEDTELFEIDGILHELGIDSPEKLYNYSPQELGYILGVDALIYGKVTRYDSSFYALYSQIAIGLAVRCISVKDATVLFEVHETRTANDVRVATNPLDFVIASFQNAMSLRDINRSRASEEVCREIVLRIPVIESLKKENENKIKERTNIEIPETIQRGYFDPFANPLNIAEKDDMKAD